MKSFTAAIALFAAAIACVSAAPTSVPAPTIVTNSTGMFRHEIGARPGLYTHHVALDGTIHTQYHGEMNSTAPISDINAVKNLRRGDTGVHCGGPTFTASDAQSAIQGLANSFNSQPHFYHAVSYSSGTATAFGCDYGKGQTMSNVEFTGYLNDVAHDCGSNKGGWYSIPDAKASYGITTSGSGFC